MSDSKASHLVETCRRTLTEYLPLWLIPTVTIGSLGSIYALVRPPTWQAVQALLVRDEAVDELAPDGHFETTDARKAAQEIVIQIARNRNVVHRALQQFAATSSRPPRKNWPREKDIKAVQDEIKVTAPKGAEFGQSDLIYLAVRARSSEEAVRLNTAVCDQLEQRLQQLRNRHAKSVVQELTEKQKLSQQNLNDATRRLEQMEKEVGSDLGELRTLNQTGVGDSNLRTTLNQIKNDLRNGRSTHTSQQQQLEILLAASQDPATLVATPNRLLESQPGLRRLKEGLIDAQLRVAELRGKMNKAHPDVKAALAAEAEVRDNLYRELETSIRGVRGDLQVTEAIIGTYEIQLNEVQQRLDQLASLRARYGNLVADVTHRREELQQSQRSLAAAHAAQEASQKSSLITRVDKPDPGDRPVGPGRLVLLLCSWVGGFAVGLGVMFLLTPVAGPAPRFGRRWTDQLVGGMMAGRRVSDRNQVSAVPSVTGGRRASDPDAGGSTPPNVAPMTKDHAQDA